MANDLEPLSHSKTLTRYLAVPLTEERKKELHEEIVTSINDKRRLEDVLDDIVKNNKKLIKSRESKIQENAEILTQGHTMICVVCNQEIDFGMNTVRIIRNDTGEVVEERAMTAQERQQLIDQRDEPMPMGQKGSRKK